MNRADYLITGQQDDQSLNLPPMTEVDMVTDVPALVRACGGFKPGIVSESRDQILCVIYAFPIGQIWHLHSQLPKIFES